MWEWTKQVSYSSLLFSAQVSENWAGVFNLEGGSQLHRSGCGAKSLGGYLNRGNVIEGKKPQKGWDENSGSPRASGMTYRVRLPV